MPNRFRPLAAAVLVVAGLLGASGCSAARHEATSRVEVAIAASAHPAAYEVQLHRQGGSFRAVHMMRSGERRVFAVPSGWMTVRIPGLCVVPTPNAGRTVIHVDSRTCRIA